MFDFLKKLKVDKICKNCKWYKLIHNNSQWRDQMCCTNKSPIVVHYSGLQNSPSSVFPPMNESDSCGEFKLKE